MQPEGLSQLHFQAPCLLFCTQFFEPGNIHRQVGWGSEQSDVVVDDLLAAGGLD